MFSANIRRAVNALQIHRIGLVFAEYSCTYVAFHSSSTVKSHKNLLKMDGKLTTLASL